MKKLTTRLALLSLLVLFPLISIYYLNKGYREQLDIQHQLVPGDRFAINGNVYSTVDSSIVGENWCSNKTTLVTIDPSKEKWDSLSLIDKGFIDESSYQTVVFWSEYPESDTENERIKCYRLDQASINPDYKGFILLDTACRIIMQKPMTSIEDYHLMSKAIVLRMPQKKKKFLVFEREIEK